MQGDLSPHPNPPTVRHGPNPVGGRDLVIGDLHGEVDTLEHALETLEFQPTRDRLFTVGDLIDRGPRSADTLAWLETGRFAGSVRGNHEQMMVNTIIADEAISFDEAGPGALWSQNGGDWWYDSEEVRNGEGAPHWTLPDRWLGALRTMPYLVRIEYPSRSVGLVHAPGATDFWHHWDRMAEWTERVCADEVFKRTSRGRVLQHDLLWKPARSHATTENDPKLERALEGVDLVISGHTPTLWPTWTRRNVVCIDTGVHYEELGHLTIAEIQDGLTLHRFARTEFFE